LKCIRDLCSASDFALEARSLNDREGLVPDSPEHIDTPGGLYWANLIPGYVRLRAEKSIVEVARLLDELLEEVVRIARAIVSLGTAPSSCPWKEMHRAVRHIRDHFDFAEEMVIDCVRPAE
jgi:hypothetical protein